MTDNLSEQAVVLSNPGTINPAQSVTRIRLFNEDGSPYIPSVGEGDGGGEIQSIPVLLSNQTSADLPDGYTGPYFQRNN